MTQKSLIQKLLDNINEINNLPSESEIVRQKYWPFEPPNDLVEVLKHGYWPVSILAYHSHWLATGCPIDDSEIECNWPGGGPVCGYRFGSFIADHITISLTITQGNVLDRSAYTTISFECYSDSGLDERLEFSITEYSQIDQALDQWPEFIQQCWPKLNREMQIIHNRSQQNLTKDDDRIYVDLCEFVWKNFNAEYKKDLLECVFYDWSALDTLTAWIQK